MYVTEAIEGRISDDDCWGCNIAPLCGKSGGVSAPSFNVGGGTDDGSCNVSGAIIAFVVDWGCSFLLRRLLRKKKEIYFL